MPKLYLARPSFFRMSPITVNMGVLAPDTCSLLLTTSAGKIIVQRVTPATPPATTVRKAPISSLVFHLSHRSEHVPGGLIGQEEEEVTGHLPGGCEASKQPRNPILF